MNYDTEIVKQKYYKIYIITSKRMEKLIKLVCEYDRFKEWKHMDRCITTWDFDNKFYRLYLVSKEYWFINRLFEKKIIDRDELYAEMNWVVYFNYYKQEVLEEYSDSDWLIMLLSIQDDPIGFLISYLK